MDEDTTTVADAIPTIINIPCGQSDEPPIDLPSTKPTKHDFGAPTDDVPPLVDPILVVSESSQEKALLMKLLIPYYLLIMSPFLLMMRLPQLLIPLKNLLTQS